jgi:hypothetical protein
MDFSWTHWQGLVLALAATQERTTVHQLVSAGIRRVGESIHNRKESVPSHLKIDRDHDTSCGQKNQVLQRGLQRTAIRPLPASMIWTRNGRRLAMGKERFH